MLGHMWRDTGLSKTSKRKKIEIKQNKERGGLITTDGEREIWKGCQLLEISPPRCVGSREVGADS